MSRVIYFEINADDPQRAIKFYQQVFGWKIEKWASPNMDYWMISTGDPKEPGIDGGLMKRMTPQASTYNTVSVSDIDEFMAKIPAQGGKITTPKHPIPGVGYYCYCTDSEGNVFGILQSDKNAK